jgi:uncharacterized protein YdaU (DUF1376 family)
MTEKKTDVWMPLWIGAYLADTMKLTTLQHGAYFLLLIAYWRERKPLADVDDELRSITKLERGEWKKARPVLAEFFKVADGVWWHKRVEAEIVAADARSKQAAGKASKAAQARWGNKSKYASADASSMPGALPEDLHDECPPPTPTPLPSEGSEAKASAAKGGDKPKITDPTEIIFGYGVPLLVAAGATDKHARSFLGGLRKEHGDTPVVDALRECIKAKPLQPMEWMAAALPPKSPEAPPAPKVPSLTVVSDDAQKTKARMDADVMTPEQREAAAKARELALSALSRTRESA